MLSRPYQGSNLGTDEVLGCVSILRKRAECGERPEFHLGAAAALEIVISHRLNDQSEFMEVMDALYNPNDEFYKVKKQDR